MSRAGTAGYPHGIGVPAVEEAVMASSDFTAQVLADKPAGYWRLGEAAGGVSAADISGNGNNGACSGGITLGQRGLDGGDTAALFDGSTGRIAVVNSATLNPPRITMEGKVRWDGANGFQQRILEKESFAGTTQYGLSVMPDGHVRVELRTKADFAVWRPFEGNWYIIDSSTGHQHVQQ
jgi:hypothetical protein